MSPCWKGLHSIMTFPPPNVIFVLVEECEFECDIQHLLPYHYVGNYIFFILINLKDKLIGMVSKYEG